MPESPVRAELLYDDRLLRLTLDAPPGNILDAAMLTAIRSSLDAHGARAGLKVVLFTGAGRHFSFGASVQEHTRPQVAGMLEQFHGLFRRMAELAIPTIAAVRGRCLGGGCELALYCSWVFAAPDAVFGQPEMKLAVFPPMASLILPWRAGGREALDLCVSGRTLPAGEAEARGLVNVVAEDPVAAAEQFFAKHLSALSGSSLRHAERAARQSLTAALQGPLRDLERIYLDELMATQDANEGIAAFLEKRAPEFVDG